MALFDGAISPAVAVELDLGRSGAFTLDQSLIGWPDLLGATFPQWTPLPCDDLIAVGLRRGRTREDQVDQPGELVVTLDNRSGDYDSDNPSSPYVYAGRSVLTRGLRVRVTATLGSSSFVIFSGLLERLDADQSNRPSVTLVCTDALAWLGRQEMPQIAGSYTADSTAQRVERVLDLAGWSATARTAMTGARLMDTTTFGASALALCSQAAACEAGRFFVTRDGLVTLSRYEDRLSKPYRAKLSDTTPGVEYDTIRTTPGAHYLVNDAIVETSPGWTQRFTVQESVDLYGLSTRKVSAPMYSSSEALTLAQILAERDAYPATRVERVEFDAPGLSSDLWLSLLASDLGDLVMVERTTVDGRAHTWTSVIESLNHDITATSWRISLDLSPGPRAGVFTIGRSLIDGPDLIWY